MNVGAARLRAPCSAAAVVYAHGMPPRTFCRRAFTAGLALAIAGLSPAGARAEPAPDAWVTELLARADQIAVKVAALRGLKLKAPIAKGVVDDEQLRARLVARMDEDAPPAKRAVEAAAAKRWGLVPWATDLDALVLDLLTEQIAGFYDPKDRTLYIASRRSSDPTWADMVMAHEIDHALQDQHFDLDKWTKVVEADDDATAARAAVIEGDGVATMIEYSLSDQGLPPPWGQEVVVRAMMASMAASVADGGASGNGELFDVAPLALREQMIFPYQAGVGFIAALRKTQPWSRVDDVFRKRPPRSTEQVLHPELYVADERPDQITATKPAAITGLVQLDASSWGEAGWGTFLRAHGIAATTAASAAAGWGGDRVVLLGPVDGAAHPETTTGIAVTTWDSEVDAREAWDALGRALDALVIGAPLVTDDAALRWLDADGRVTAAERKGARIAIVVGAPLVHWRTLLDGAWTWKVKPGR
jgi:hypothetical protein